MSLKLRRITLLVMGLLAVLSTTLLLNFTAPNPTGRRYSSANPVDLAKTIDTSDWRAAEMILERDLGAPFNDTAQTRTCLCNQQNHKTPPNRCNTCALPPVELSQSFALPDFITDEYLADSKYVQRFSSDSQIEDFLAYAELANYEVWIFVRVDSDFSVQTAQRIAATGGRIVPYFVTAGYVDPIDRAASNVLIISLVVIAVLLGLEAVLYIRRQHESGEPPAQEEDLPDEVEQAKRSTETTEAYMKRIERLSRREIDEEDSRHNGKPKK